MTPMMENQMEKRMENEMAATVHRAVQGLYGSFPKHRGDPNISPEILKSLLQGFSQKGTPDFGRSPHKP